MWGLPNYLTPVSIGWDLIRWRASAFVWQPDRFRDLVSFYILDELSIGLHQRDNDRLIASLKKMRDLGNTLIVVEHDEDTMREADYLIDVGPGAGVFGRDRCGTPKQVARNSKRIYWSVLVRQAQDSVPTERRSEWSFY